LRFLLATVLCVVMLAGAGCADDADESPADDLVSSLVDEYGCGFAFYLGSADQTAGLFAVYTDFEAARAGDIPAITTLPDDRWIVEVEIGQRLFANWCDGTVPPPDPPAAVEETWMVTAGTITILELPPAGACGPARARLSGFEAVAPDGIRLTLGDIEVANPTFGCFAL